MCLLIWTLSQVSDVANGPLVVISLISPLGQRTNLNPHSTWMFVPSLVEIGPVGSEKRGKCLQTDGRTECGTTDDKREREREKVEQRDGQTDSYFLVPGANSDLGLSVQNSMSFDRFLFGAQRYRDFSVQFRSCAAISNSSLLLGQLSTG